MKLKKILGLASIACVPSDFAACGGKSNSAKSDTTELKVGIMTLDDATEPLWDKVKTY